MEEKRGSQRFSQQVLESRGKDGKDYSQASIDPLSHVWQVVRLVNYAAKIVKAHFE